MKENGYTVNTTGEDLDQTALQNEAYMFSLHLKYLNIY
jgi:hypothetical protein